MPKPDHLQWDIITREKFEQVGILKELQFREKKAGKCVKLSDGYEDIAPEKDVGDLETESNKQRINGDPYGSENTEKVYKGRESKNPKRNNPRKRVDRNAANHHSNGSNNESRSNGISTAFDKNETKRKDGQRNKRNLNNRNHESIGIFVGRIPRTARVKELKDAIQERGLRTNNLVWKGVKGFAFLYFDKSHTNMSEEEICLQLKDLKLGETVLNIEPDKRKDKLKADIDDKVQGETQEHNADSVHSQKHERTKEDKTKRQHINKPRSNKKSNSPTNLQPTAEHDTLPENDDTENIEKYSAEINPEKCGNSHLTTGVENGITNAQCLSSSQKSEKQNTSDATEDTSKMEGKDGQLEVDEKICLNINKSVSVDEEGTITSSNTEQPLSTVHLPQVNHDTKEKTEMKSVSNDKSKSNSQDKPNELDSSQNIRSPTETISNEPMKSADSPKRSNIKTAEENGTKTNPTIASVSNGDKSIPTTEEVQSKEKDDKAIDSKKTSTISDSTIKPHSIISTKTSDETSPQKQSEPSKDIPKEKEQKQESEKASTEEKDCTEKSQKNKQKSVETSAKKEGEKTVAKSESVSTKKEKSKSPDKEVKKEESSGGGFFKRFWK